MHEKKYTLSDVIDENVEPYMVYFADGTSTTVTLDRRLSQHLCLSGKKAFFKSLLEKSYEKPVRTLFYMSETNNGLSSHILHLMLESDNDRPRSQVFIGASVWGCLHSACVWLQANYSNELLDYFRIDGVKYKFDIWVLNSWFLEEITTEELLATLRKGETTK